MPEPPVEDPRSGPGGPLGERGAGFRELLAPVLRGGETVRACCQGECGGFAGRGSRSVVVALTGRRLILLHLGPPGSESGPGTGSGWADPVGRVVVESFRQGRNGSSRFRLRRLAVPDRLVRIRVGVEWRAEVALIAAALPRATPFTLPD
jgi:hypothetical protein